MNILRLLFFVAVILFTGSAGAQSPDGGEQPGPNPPQIDPPKNDPLKIDPLKVTVTLAQDGKRDINNQLSVFVDLENPTKDRIQINRLYLLLGDDIVNTRPLQSYDSTKEWARPVDQPGLLPSPYNYPLDGQWSGPEKAVGFDLSAGGRQSLTLTIPPGDGGSPGPSGFSHYLATLFGNSNLLTFNPKDHNIHVVVDYSDGAGQNFSQRVTAKVSFTATCGAIMLGGLLGVVLLFILRVTVAVVDESIKVVKPSEAPTWQGFQAACRKMALRAVWVGLSEAVAALVWLPSVVVICVLLMRMEPGSFPITFQVNDFTGGVMLGLFTRALIEPLIRKLFPSNDGNPPNPAAVGSLPAAAPAAAPVDPDPAPVEAVQAHVDPAPGPLGEAHQVPARPEQGDV